MDDCESLTLQKLALTLYLYHRGQFDLAYTIYFLEKAENLRIFLAEYPVPCSPTAAQCHT